LSCGAWFVNDQALRAGVVEEAVVGDLPSVGAGVGEEESVADGEGVDVTFSDGTRARYDIVIGADGIFSQTRRLIIPDAPQPRYTGQWVWRYNLPKQVSTDEFQIFHGPCNAGLVPLARGMTYVFILSEEAPDYRLELEGAAEEMRRRADKAAPQIREAAEQVVDDAGVVGRPLEVVFLDGAWHKGRVVLLGDAVHASTPHLGQGAGMAIEDAIVLTEELERASDPEAAFTAYRERRFERVKFIVENSIRIGDAQMRKIPPVNVGEISGRMMRMMAQPI
jgi:2-polyprenyl-6-methoxyphenol hydroxylase-like FAD-dependent oxidoreductase